MAKCLRGKCHTSAFMYSYNAVDIHKSLGIIWELKWTFLQEKTIQSIGHEERSGYGGFAELKDFLSCSDQEFQEDAKGSSDSRCLHEILEEAQSDSPVSFYSHLDSSEGSDDEVKRLLYHSVKNYNGEGSLLFPFCRTSSLVSYHYQKNSYQKCDFNSPYLKIYKDVKTPTLLKTGQLSSCKT
jgi:hypothetical protein